MNNKQRLKNFKNMLYVATTDIDHILHFDQEIIASIAYILNYSGEYDCDTEGEIAEKTFEFLIGEFRGFMISEFENSVYDSEWTHKDAPKVGTPADWFNFLTINHGNDESLNKYQDHVQYFADVMKD